MQYWQNCKIDCARRHGSAMPRNLPAVAMTSAVDPARRLLPDAVRGLFRGDRVRARRGVAVFGVAVVVAPRSIPEPALLARALWRGARRHGAATSSRAACP